MRRWLASVAVALAVLGVAGCVPGRSPRTRLSMTMAAALVTPTASAAHETATSAPDRVQLSVSAASR